MAEAQSEAVYLSSTETNAPGVDVPGKDVPTKRIDSRGLKMLGQNLGSLFNQYRSDRVIQEERWLRNLRQYLGFYDPEVEKFLTPDRSKAYPKITRVKCISMLARIIDLMFPSDDRNWTLKARPSPDMDIKDVKQAIADAQERDAAAGAATQAPGAPPPPPAPLTSEYIHEAVTELAMKRAQELMVEIDDQLQEIGGDQSYDYVALNKQVVASGILYGIGVVEGPYAREVKTSTWELDPKTQQPRAKVITTYMPQFNFLRCWDYYPDMSAKRIEDGDGYFAREVMSKRQLRDLADRDDVFGSVIKSYLNEHSKGNYKAQAFETQLRGMGVKVNVNEQKAETSKYEIIKWRGPVDGSYLQMAGVEIADDKRSDQIDAEVWLLDNYVIKAVMNPWAEVGMNVKTSHAFIFDHDDTAPIGFGLPNIMRDTQMSISAATRMMMDNASVTCGPILEINTALMQSGQDLTSLHAYKIFMRDDEGQTAQFPAVRDVKVESHIQELEQIITLFLKFADMETFVSPMNGGDMSQMPSEPMRSAPGASMMLGHAALPFKDIIRNFDRFTMSVILALVAFNRALNPTKAKVGDYDVIARGATSLIAKEMRGQAIDSLVTTLTPEEKIHADMRKITAARFAVRDLEDMMVSENEAKRRQDAQDQNMSQQQDIATRTAEAAIRKELADAFKAMTQGQKNQATANVEQVDAALSIMERDSKGALTHAQTIKTHADTAATLAGAAQGGQDAGAGDQAPGGGSDPNDPGGSDQPGGGMDPGAGGPPGGPGGAGLGLMLPGGSPSPAGPGPGAPFAPQ